MKIEINKEKSTPQLQETIWSKVKIKLKEVYGEENNWQGKLWKFKEIFGNECEKKQFYCEFHSEDGRFLAQVPVGDRVEDYGLKSPAFRDWLLWPAARPLPQHPGNTDKR
mgnify:CR=1 FL=1